MHQAFGRWQVVAARVVATDGEQACQHHTGQGVSTRHHFVPPRRSVGRSAASARAAMNLFYGLIDMDWLAGRSYNPASSACVTYTVTNHRAFRPRACSLCGLMFVRLAPDSLVKPSKPDHDENFAQFAAVWIADIPRVRRRRADTCSAGVASGASKFPIAQQRGRGAAASRFAGWTGARAAGDFGGRFAAQPLHEASPADQHVRPATGGERNVPAILR